MEALLHMERDQSTTNVSTQSHHAMKSDSGSEGKQELVTVVDGNSNDFFMNLSFDTMALHSDEPLPSVSISKIAFTLPSAIFCRRARSICNLRCAQFSDWSAFRMSRRTCKYMHLDSRPALTARVRGDGNCLFRAISFLLTEGDEDQHLAVRAKVVEFEKEHFNYFEQFSIGSDSNFAEHVAAMSAPGKWGTAVELFAVATLLTSDVWTFYGGKWLVYRPRFRVQPDGSMLGFAFGGLILLRHASAVGLGAPA
uniref:OTU domain-containing protein n=1 Tax=Parascaris univalens TaxID=6257 RepID=A0A915A0Z1_PARUN